ncbi:MAG: hypothetical protein ACLFQY_10485 [Desulfococcaceae bacterium]
MDIFTRDDLKELIEKQNGPCLSLYMPTYRGWKDAQQNPIRFKNLLNKAEDMWKAVSSEKKVPNDIFEPARNLVEDFSFWQYQSDGFAMFLSDGVARTYRLPVEFDEVTVVTERFHMKPVLPYLSKDNRFFILAVSQNRIRFFQCTRHKIQEIEPEAMPKNMAEALKFDEFEKQLQFTTKTGTVQNQGAGGPSTGDRAAIFHGYGVGTDDEKDAISRYLRQVDHALKEFLRDEDAPLVLAGVEVVLRLFREVSGYSNILEEEVHGNPDELSPEDLHQKAWKAVEPHFKKDQEAAAQRYADSAHTDSASQDLRAIIPAAYFSRIDLLFVTTQVRQWGKYDPEADTLDLHDREEPGDQDMLDFAAVYTLLNGGTVYAVPPKEMPAEGAHAAALFRFPA